MMTRRGNSERDPLAALSKDQTELVRLLLKKEFDSTDEIKAYPRANGVARVRMPTSWTQQQLWFIDHLDGAGVAYHIPVAARLQGVLDEHALREALHALVRRHEIFRTVFVNAKGDPQQEIVAEAHFRMSSIDLTGYHGEELEAQVGLHKLEEAHMRFDLQQGPLIRGRLLLLQPREHVLLITMHHIVCDGWSMGVFFNELAELYEAYRDGRGNPLKPLPIQFADYSQWQREWLRGKALQEQLRYWRAHLGGASPQLELPTDRPRPAIQSHRGGKVQVNLDSKLCGRLKILALENEMTLFMVLFAGWALLLSRLSGQDDVVIGTPIANRQRPELSALIGPFVSTLVLRIAARPDLSLDEYLREVKELSLQAYDHQDVPFEQIVESLQPQRSLSRNPIFQVMFALQNSPKSNFELRDLSVTLEDVGYESSMFDLSLALEERGDTIAGKLNYAADLFDHDTVHRWVRCFEELLTAMTNEVAHTRIGALSILPVDERRCVVNAFNATRADYQYEKLIHQLIEERVQVAPASIAVEYEGKTLTYSELNARANQLARYLRRHGVGPDQLVGIAVDRSLEMVIGLLGILKAGGAYVPLDPHYPRERLQYMVSDAAPRVLLTQDRFLGTFSSLASKVLSLDGGGEELVHFEAEDLDPNSMQLTPRNLAYVIYTSGSTGAPKGAMNEHRGVVNRLLWMQERYGLGDQDRVLQKTPFSFDVSVWEFFWTLLSGARLIVARPQGHQDPDYLMTLIDESQATTLHFVPSMLQAFLERHQVGRCESVRHIVCSGEELTVALQNKCLVHLPHARLSNLYGPTEAAVDVTAWECQPQQVGTRVPIGRPISNIQIYVLDGIGQPVPVGVSGEIYIGGAGVGRGYLNRTDLTSERFRPDPFSVDPRARLYKTGDVGRWRSDGAIEYLGRNDHQIKLRGFRIELGEIEALLARHEKVREAVVVAREDTPGDKRLVAYVVSTDGLAPSAEALREHLMATLPEYMVPSAFVGMKGLPLTPSGKLDRRALPAPDLGAYARRKYEPPLGKLEVVLASIWQQLLQISQVGRDDNFFELGGHSLHGMKLIAKVAEQLDVQLSAIAVFQYPTIRQMAQMVESRRATPTQSVNCGEGEYDEGVV